MARGAVRAAAGLKGTSFQPFGWDGRGPAFPMGLALRRPLPRPHPSPGPTRSGQW